jgi:YidC/Oxa1 family membrane protein insertase
MAEPGSGGSPKEMSMEVRLLLAFLLMGVVMFLTPYIYKTPPPAKNAQKTTAAQTEPSQAPAAPAAAETAAPIAPATPAFAPTEPATVAVSLPPVQIDTDLFRVTFNNQGATVRSWQLKKYKGNDNKPLDLVNPAIGSSDVPFPFSLYFAGQPPTAKVNQVITPSRRTRTAWASPSATATATPVFARRSVSGATATCARFRAK